MPKDFRTALSGRESGGRYNNDTSPYGYMGKYQMGESALISVGVYQRDGTSRNDWNGQFVGPISQKYGVTNIKGFLNSPQMQEEVMEHYFAANSQTLKRLGTDRFIGQSSHYIDKSGVRHDFIINREALIYASWLGPQSVHDLLSQGQEFKDGLGTNIREYLWRGSQTQFDSRLAQIADGASLASLPPLAVEKKAASNNFMKAAVPVALGTTALLAAKKVVPGILPDLPFFGGGKDGKGGKDPLKDFSFSDTLFFGIGAGFIAGLINMNGGGDDDKPDRAVASAEGNKRSRGNSPGGGISLTGVSLSGQPDVSAPDAAEESYASLASNLAEAKKLQGEDVGAPPRPSRGVVLDS